MTPSEPTSDVAADLKRVRAGCETLHANVAEHFLGHADVVDLLVSCVLVDGHCLLEGAPGLGKTTLVKGLAAALGLTFHRVQFTPDLMPGDILGLRILDEDSAGRRSFRFEEGPVFTQILLADEINRATPRTQSALLEAMAERQVTMFGETRPLPSPFFVIATQNPIEMEGTYPLPEAQLDRFLCKIELKGPSEDELVAILAATSGAPVAPDGPAFDAALFAEMRRLAAAMPTSSDVTRLAARTVLYTDPTREDAPEEIQRYLRFGSSPRGGQALLRLGRARALLRGRPWVSEEDLGEVAGPALRHRLVFSYEGEASGVHADELVRLALEKARG